MLGLGEIIWFSTSVSVWQHVHLSEKSHPWDTLACYSFVKKPPWTATTTTVSSTCLPGTNTSSGSLLIILFANRSHPILRWLSHKDQSGRRFTPVKVEGLYRKPVVPTESQSVVRPWRLRQSSRNIVIDLPEWRKDHSCYHSHRCNEPTEKTEPGMGCPDWYSLRIQVRLRVYSSGHGRIKENEPGERLPSRHHKQSTSSWGRGATRLDKLSERG